MANQVENWQTPTSLDSAGRDYTYPSGDHTKPFPTLVGQARDWPTPNARDHKDGADPSGEVETNALLGRAAPRWDCPSSPPAPPTEPPGSGSSQGGPNSRRLWKRDNVWATPCGGEAMGATDKTKRGNLALGGEVRAFSGDNPKDGMTTSKRRLNPNFVRWMMSWPPGWVESISCEPAGMASWLSKALSRYESFFSEQDLDDDLTQ